MRTGLFDKTEVYRMTAHGLIVPSPQAIYYLGGEAQLNGSVELFRDAVSAVVVDDMKPKTRIELIGYAPTTQAAGKRCMPVKKHSGFNSCDLFLIKSSRGVMGWISLSTLETKAKLHWVD